MARVLFAINPHSSAPPLTDFVPEARRQLFGHSVYTFVPQRLEEFILVADQAERLQADALVLVGGDGTNQLFSEGVIRSGRPTYLFASGTANDLARNAGHIASWSALRKALKNQKTRRIDVIDINGIPFTTVGGLGVGATLTSQMNDWRSRWPVFKESTKALGKHSYPLLGVQVIGTGSYETLDARITIDGCTEAFKTACILVANQPCLGGNLLVSPLADNTDGFVDILVLTDPSRGGLLRALFEMSQGRTPHDAQLRRASQATIAIAGNKPTTFFADGETLCHDTTFHISVRNKALNLIDGSLLQENIA